MWSFIGGKEGAWNPEVSLVTCPQIPYVVTTQQHISIQVVLAMFPWDSFICAQVLSVV